MKLKLVSAIVLSGLLSAQSWAETAYETAPVIESRAIYEVVEISTPQEQCWEEEAAVDCHSNGRGSNTPILVSTIIGGAIGNAVGHNKSNKRIGAVLGLCWDTP